MPQSKPQLSRRRREAGLGKSKLKRGSKAGARYSVGLSSTLVQQVERYAETVDASMSKAIAALVRIGLESQANRKREFLTRLRENLDNHDPQQQDRLVDEFRDIILGR